MPRADGSRRGTAWQSPGSAATPIASTLDPTTVPTRPSGAENYVRLGRAVVEHALRELTAIQANGRPAKTTRRNAERFLLGPNECAYWCWLAEIDHDRVVEKARKIIASRG